MGVDEGWGGGYGDTNFGVTHPKAADLFKILKFKIFKITKNSVTFVKLRLQVIFDLSCNFATDVPLEFQPWASPLLATPLPPITPIASLVSHIEVLFLEKYPSCPSPPIIGLVQPTLTSWRRPDRGDNNPRFMFLRDLPILQHIMMILKNFWNFNRFNLTYVWLKNALIFAHFCFQIHNFFLAAGASPPHPFALSCAEALMFSATQHTFRKLYERTEDVIFVVEFQTDGA